MTNILHKFHHGIGDAVMFTAVLKHLKSYRPDWEQDVWALKGKHTAFTAVARDGFDNEPPRSKYNNFYDHSWDECWDSWPDSPGTKTALCLRQKFNLSPVWELLKYEMSIGPAAKDRAETYIKTLPNKPFVLIHYEGNTSQKEKNLPHQVIRDVCDYLLDRGYTPVILDWDRRSPIPDQRTVFNPDVDNPIWMSHGTGDAETIAALVERAALFIGIDSGPCKVAYCTKTPNLTCWVGHHPYHYVDNAPNVLHLVPDNHRDHLRGDKLAGLEFFARHYRYETYGPGQLTGYIKQQAAKLLGLSYNPMAASDLLTATSYAEEYYEQHRRAGLDYLNYGKWQEEYGKWFVESLGLKGKSVLDVGCACGSIASGFARAGALVSGVDVNEHMITLGRTKWLKEQLKICDASNLHYWKDATFDFIHSAQVFEHFKASLVPNILDELHRVTKPDGALFVALDTTEMFERQGRDLAHEDATHVCVKPMAWWDELLPKHGWERAPDLDDKLKNHPGSYFQNYDWDYFIVRKQ